MGVAVPGRGACVWVHRSGAVPALGSVAPCMWSWEGLPVRLPSPRACACLSLDVISVPCGEINIRCLHTAL